MNVIKKCLTGALLASVIGSAHAGKTLIFGEASPTRGARTARDAQPRRDATWCATRHWWTPGGVWRT